MEYRVMARGRPTDYKPDFHPKEIIRLMREEGLTTVEVAEKWDVCVDTLTEWRHKHKTFSSAYTRAKQYRKAWWLKAGRSGLFTEGEVKFDSRLFGLMMKYDGINLDERIVKLPELANCKTFSEQATVICGALACGRITIKEAQGYVDVISICAKIDEVTNLRDKLEAIERQLGK
jgi:hypothetical protein